MGVEGVLGVALSGAGPGLARFPVRSLPGSWQALFPVDGTAARAPNGRTPPPSRQPLMPQVTPQRSRGSWRPGLRREGPRRTTHVLLAACPTAADTAARACPSTGGRVCAVCILGRGQFTTGGQPGVAATPVMVRSTPKAIRGQHGVQSTRAGKPLRAEDAGGRSGSRACLRAGCGRTRPVCLALRRDAKALTGGGERFVLPGSAVRRFAAAGPLQRIRPGPVGAGLPRSWAVRPRVESDGGCVVDYELRWSCWTV